MDPPNTDIVTETPNLTFAEKVLDLAKPVEGFERLPTVRSEQMPDYAMDNAIWKISSPGSLVLDAGYGIAANVKAYLLKSNHCRFTERETDSCFVAKMTQPLVSRFSSKDQNEDSDIYKRDDVECVTEAYLKAIRYGKGSRRKET